mmetsp:Transcript_11429/g.33690  ORF Transcript_11429/g.33690 Transcript_11429/m.33690 type:complete len:210 (+) Transcript_11429:108-737(+)
MTHVYEKVSERTSEFPADSIAAMRRRTASDFSALSKSELVAHPCMSVSMILALGRSPSRPPFSYSSTIRSKRAVAFSMLSVDLSLAWALITDEYSATSGRRYEPSPPGLSPLPLPPPPSFSLSFSFSWAFLSSAALFSAALRSFSAFSADPPSLDRARALMTLVVVLKSGFIAQSPFSLYNRSIFPNNSSARCAAPLLLDLARVEITPL